jgi:hypothetical protein
LGHDLLYVQYCKRKFCHPKNRLKMAALLEKPPGHPSANLVRPNLVLGSIFDVQSADILREWRIGHIISISKLSTPKPGHDATCGVSRIAIDDNVGHALVDHFPAAVREITEALDRLHGQCMHRVLVHCEYGISRSAAVVVACLMACENMGAKAAICSVRECRPLAFSMPDPAFFDAILSWQQQLIGSWTPDQIQQTELVASVSDLIAVVDEGMLGEPGEAASSAGAVVVADVGPVLGDGSSGGSSESQMSDAVIKHKNHIAEHILTLHCPECAMAFLDFTNCFALWCARCDCAFCAVRI